VCYKYIRFYKENGRTKEGKSIKSKVPNNGLIIMAELEKSVSLIINYTYEQSMKIEIFR